MELAKLILEYVKVLAWPMTAIFLGIYFRKSLVAVLARLEKATLPGGISLDFDKKIQQIEALSEKVSANPEPQQQPKATLIVTTDANKRMIELGLMPVQSDLNISYFEELADHDPALAIAAPRMEIEILAKNLVIACKIPISTDRSSSALSLIRELSANKALKEYQSSLAIQIVQLCNLVIHGKRISRESAEKVFNGVAILYMDYLLWLSTK